MSSQIITVPDIGGAEGVEVIEVSVAVGDVIALEQSLIVLETDKATVEVPSTVAGKITDITVKAGDKVSEGDAICSIESQTQSTAEPVSENPTEPQSQAQTQPQPTNIGSQLDGQQLDCVVPDGVEGAEVIEVAINVGDQLNEGDTVATLETDKATVEVPATASGKVVSVAIKVGDNLTSGDLVAKVMAAGAEQAAPSSTELSSPVPSEPVESTEARGSTNQTVIVTLLVPEGAENAQVIELVVKEGDQIAEGDSLAVLETDKATVEVPASAGGKIVKLLASVGDSLSSGDPVAECEVVGSASQPASPDSSEPQKPSHQTAEQAPPRHSASDKPTPPSGAVNSVISEASEVYAGPAVRTHARLLGVNLHEVKASGPKNRILKEDVDNFVKQVIATRDKHKPSGTLAAEGAGIPPMPVVDFSKFGEVETLPMTKIQKVTAFNMHRNWLHIPAVTQFDDADITELEGFRKSLKAESEKRGVKLTPLPFLLKAAASALLHEPKFNSSLGPDGESLIRKHYVHIGIAADTPAGLVVPVLRDVDKKGLWQLASEANELIAKARDGKLAPKDMQGGCFTISSLGAMGGKGFTPIVNAPEVGILAVSKADVKPVWSGKEFVPRTMLPLGLSYDHRVINGADCGRFFTHLVDILSDIRKLLL